MTETQAQAGLAGGSARSQEPPAETDRPQGRVFSPVDSDGAGEGRGAHTAADPDEVDEGPDPLPSGSPVIGRVSVIPGPPGGTPSASSVPGGTGSASGGGAVGGGSVGGGAGSGSSASTSGGASRGSTGRAPVPSSLPPLKATPDVSQSAAPGRSRTAASAALDAVGRAGRAMAGGAAVGAAKVTDAARTARANMAAASSRGPRKARLNLKRIDPWSVMKFSFAVSLVLFVVAIVATSVLYLALDAMHVFDSINSAFAEVTGPTDGEDSVLKVTAKGVIGTSVLLGAVNMVLFTALATLGAFVYNVCADLVGGVELTLSEKE